MTSKYLYIGNNQIKKLDILPDKPINKIRLVFISDTHEKHEELNIPPADILIHCGDIILQGRKHSDTESLKIYRDFNNWLGKLNCTHKLIIGGNHDNFLNQIGPTESKKIFTKCYYMFNEFFNINGLNFFASPFNIGNSRNNAFQSKNIFTDLDLKTSNTNTKIDFLITHGPLDDKFFINKQIGCHVWGHLHYYWGVYNIASKIGKKSNDILSICACSMNGDYNINNAPIVMDL